MTVIINGTTGVTSVNGSAAAPSVTGTDTDTGIVYGTNTVTIATGGTAGLVQDSSQNISIGGSVAGQKLNVKGVVALEAISGSTNNWMNYTYTDGTLRWNYNGSGSDELILNSNGVLSLVGASTTANGAGICFPPTQSASTDANTLDDYEEGTWTPSYAGGGSNPTVVYSVRGGTYVKVGRVVIASVRLTVSSASGGSGNLTITGLPFAVDTGNGNCWSGTVGWNSQGSFANNHHMTSIEAAFGNTFLYCHYSTSTGATYDVNTADLQANASIEASIVYMAST